MSWPTCPEWCTWSNPRHWHDKSRNFMPVDIPTDPDGIEYEATLLDLIPR